MTAYKPYFLELWGVLPSSVDELAREDFAMCKALIDRRLSRRREGGG